MSTSINKTLQKQIIDQLNIGKVNPSALNAAYSIPMHEWSPDLFESVTKVLNKMRKHKLLTNELLKKLPAMNGEVELKDQKAIVKFFDPCSQWTWYMSQYDPENQIGFGLVRGFEKELGTFSLKEISVTTNRLGLPIERDLYWDDNQSLLDLLNNDHY